MKEMPEKIWASPRGDYWATEDIGSFRDTPYVRADLHDALRAENERLRTALAGRVDPDRGGVVLRNCSEPEPTIRHMVHYYYRTAFSAAASASLAEALFAALAQDGDD